MYSEITSNKQKSALLILLFMVFIVAIGWFINYFFEIGPGMILGAGIFSVVSALISYFKGDAIALAVSGARPLVKADNAYVYNLVENLCITAGIPTPKIYVIQDAALNAFATGRDPQHASIALTTGIISALENEELEGVIAHELSHVKNYDIRLATVAIICVGFIALLSDFATRGMFWGGRGRSNSDNRGSFGGILAIIGIVMIILAPLAAKLIQLAVSRKREFLADASGALLTRYPEGLARALEKIAANPHPLARASQATAHLYIDEPLKRGTITSRIAGLFSTHPPLAERIHRLRTFA